jgi:phospholipase C
VSLSKIDHIVVLMMENRSFDHILGYLSLPEHSEGAPPVNGLSSSMPPSEYTGAEFSYPDVDELVHYSAPLYPDPPPEHRLPPLTPLWEDPPHDVASQDVQINDGAMDGFVDAYAARLYERLSEYGRTPDWRVLGYPMGYLEPKDVPVYDYLARTYCVCDNWFCSVRGPTMPNRFFSVAGTTNGILDNTKILLHRRNAFRSFFRHLRSGSWRWYSSDPAVLRAVDDEFLRDSYDDRFAYFDQATERQSRSFLSDLFGSDDQQPDLPSVAWIDPNFAITAEDGHLVSNDDHPPSPVIRGQKLVNKVYETLRQSKYWDRSMLVITYDEHGGFFDHQGPPRPELGPRVPALVVSPHVKPGRCGVEFEHASLIKTILLRFNEDALGLMPARVQEANDLWVTLNPEGERVSGCPVPRPGKAGLDAQDFLPDYLPKPASTVPRAVELLDRAPTDLQVDVARMAIILRSGLRNYFRLQELVKSWSPSHRRRPKLAQSQLKAIVDLRRRLQPSNRKLAERRP